MAGVGVVPLTQQSSSSFGQQFDQEWSLISNGLKRPHVLLAGNAKSGKSSIVDCIYGPGSANNGGLPVTTDYNEFNSSDKDVVLYDGPGLVPGKLDAYFGSLKRFLEKHTEADDVVNEVHVVWYVVNGQAPKMEAGEETIIRKVFRDLPIVVIITKSDLATAAGIRKLRETIDSWNITNIKGIIEVSTKNANAFVATSKTTVCPRCSSDEVVVRLGKKQFTCSSCKLELPLSAPAASANGKNSVTAAADSLENAVANATQLSQVLALTNNLLPSITHESFICNRFHSLALNEERSKLAIMSLFDTISKNRSSSAVMTATSNTLYELSNIWSFRRAEMNAYCQSTTQHLMKKSKFSLALLVEEDKHLKRQAIALAMLWARCLRRLAVRLVKEYVANNHNGAVIDNNYTSYVPDSFTELNAENLAKIEETLVFNGMRGYMLPGAERRHFEQAVENDKQILNELFAEVH